MIKHCANNYYFLLLGLFIALFYLSPAKAASFKLSSSESSIPYNCTQELNIIIDTEGKISNAAEIEITYDPVLITIIDSEPDFPGVQIGKGNAFYSFIENSVNSGTIRLTAASYSAPLSGQKIFGIIEYKANSFSALPANFIIKFTGIGMTLDSNIAEESTSRDILSSVENISIDILNNNICPTPMVTPSPTGTIIITPTASITITPTSILTTPTPTTTIALVKTPSDVVDAFQRTYNDIVPLSPVFTGAAITTTTILAPLAILAYPQALIYGFLWLTRRKRSKPWGVIYDDDSLKPISFAIVRAVETYTKKFVKQSVTDSEGRYGFVLDKGSYIITITHPDYETKEININIKENADILYLDYGLRKSDIKKRSFLSIRSKLRGKLYYISILLTSIGFTFSLIALITSPVVLNFILFSAYIIQFFYLFGSKRRKNWGVIMTSDKRPIKGAFVRLFDVENERQVDVQITDFMGRFNFIIEKKDYLLKVDCNGYRMASNQTNLPTIQKGQNTYIKVNGMEQINLPIVLQPL